MKIFSVCRVSLNAVVLLATCLFTSQAFSQDKPIPSFSTNKASQFLLTDITKTANNLVAVGERGHIIYSSNGTNWQQASVPVNVLLTSIAFKDDRLGFATGHDATLLKTEDGGVSWQIVNYQPELDKPLLDIAISGDSVVAIGAYGLYWYSHDSGQNWNTEFHDELLHADDREYLEEIKLDDPETYELEKQFLLPHFNAISLYKDTWVMVGEAGFVAMSSNQGKDWTSLETDYFGSYFSVLANSQRILLAGLRGNLYESDDKGNSWHSLQTGIKATINSALEVDGRYYLFANSGNLFYQTPQSEIDSYTFADGKALMAGVAFEQSLVLATESGIKSIKLTDLK